MSDFIVQNKKPISLSKDDGNFFAYSSISRDFLEGINAAWPDRQWSIFSGTLTINNEEILQHNGIAPLIAWQGDQVWKLMGRILGGNFKPRYMDNKNSIFGVSLLGVNATNKNVAMMGLIAGAVTLSRNSEHIDAIMYRFINRVSQAKEAMEDNGAYL